MLWQQRGRNPYESAQILRQINVPALLIWGEQDPYLGIELTDGLERWVPGIRVERIPEASHWVQVDAADRVNELVLEFLQEG
jgi:pimeloyl-ACP methyl ester carboxylesterase